MPLKYQFTLQKKTDFSIISCLSAQVWFGTDNLLTKETLLTTLITRIIPGQVHLTFWCLSQIRKQIKSIRYKCWVLLFESYTYKYVRPFQHLLSSSRPPIMHPVVQWSRHLLVPTGLRDSGFRSRLSPILWLVSVTKAIIHHHKLCLFISTESVTTEYRVDIAVIINCD